VDLLIRTSGEQRLSDFLLWECAYAEMIFTPRMWPVFTGEDLAEAVAEFRGRDRRFGRLHSEHTARHTALTSIHSKREIPAAHWNRPGRDPSGRPRAALLHQRESVP